MNALLKEAPVPGSVPPASVIDFAWAYYVRYLAEAAHGTPPGFDWRTQWAVAARDAFGNGFKKDGSQKQPSWQQVPGMTSAAFISPTRVILFDMSKESAGDKPVPRHCFPRPGWDILPIGCLKGKAAGNGKPAIRSMLDDWLFDPPSVPWLVFAAGQAYVPADQLVVNSPNAAVTGVRLADSYASVNVADLRAFDALTREAGVDWKTLWAAAGLPLATNELEPARAKAAKRVPPDVQRRASTLLRKRTLTRAVIKDYFNWRKLA